LYAICTPDRWGLRYSDEDNERDGQLTYPVARDYAKAILSVLMSVQWGNAYFGKPGSTPSLRLSWPPNSENEQDRLFDLVRPVVSSALTSPAAGFGIPESAVPVNVCFYTPPPGSPSGEQGTFIPNDWSLNLNANMLEPMFRIKTPARASDVANRNDQLEPLRRLADTLYHEARHCQQWFWIFALVQQHFDNFEAAPDIAKWPMELITSSPRTSQQALATVGLAAKQALPVEPTALVSLKRMAVGQYLYTLNLWRSAKPPYYPSFAPNAAQMDGIFHHAREAAIDLLQHVGIGGTSIDVDAMVAEPSRCYCDYTARPWENDAFVCGEMATAYWKADLGLGLKTYAEDQCSRAYEHADADNKLAARLAGIATGSAGGDETAGGDN